MMGSLPTRPSLSSMVCLSTAIATDSSVAKVKTFTSAKIKLFHQDNLGASKARNHAASFAKGTFIAFLDADDIWKPNHLECIKVSDFQ